MGLVGGHAATRLCLQVIPAARLPRKLWPAAINDIPTNADPGVKPGASSGVGFAYGSPPPAPPLRLRVRFATPPHVWKHPQNLRLRVRLLSPPPRSSPPPYGPQPPLPPPLLPMLPTTLRRSYLPFSPFKAHSLSLPRSLPPRSLAPAFYSSSFLSRCTSLVNLLSILISIQLFTTYVPCLSFLVPLLLSGSLGFFLIAFKLVSYTGRIRRMLQIVACASAPLAEDTELRTEIKYLWQVYPIKKRHTRRPSKKRGFLRFLYAKVRCGVVSCSACPKCAYHFVLP